MKLKSAEKYQPFQPINLPNRQWPNQVTTKAPIWCSVDLRDGNQALIEPMGDERKQRMYDLLIKLGFKHIEAGFPAASQTDFDFLRKLIDNNLIPDDVTIQVLVQAREPLIARTFEALKGIKQAIVHVYNSTSTLQRRVVFKQDKAGVKQIALNGATWVKQYAEKYPETQWTFQYSPESFTGTELDYAVDICDSVCDIWQPTPTKKCIINLPSTVEMSTPNIFADQIEWFANNTKYRESIVLSVHTHNDRGTGIAATELAMLAGADRVEGTLFGNGERTGNVDLITCALNLHTQGIEPELDLSDLMSVRKTVEYCNRLPINERHPYVGDLVFTAFSGSHQDAIKKGFDVYHNGNDTQWQVPYLTIDPADIGRSYEAIIRVNSQSGKGGVAYLLENDYGLRLPRRLQIEFSQIIQQITDSDEKEVSSNDIYQCFENEYLNVSEPIKLLSYSSQSENEDSRHIEAKVLINGKETILKGSGTGPIDAYVHALKDALNLNFSFVDYQEHAVSEGESSLAFSYVEIKLPSHQLNNQTINLFGVGRHGSIVMSSLLAVTNVINRAINKQYFTLCETY